MDRPRADATQEQAALDGDPSGPDLGAEGEPASPREARARLVRVWLPVIGWAALIFALSSIPSLGTGLGTWDLALRKIAHAAEFAVLAILLRRAFSTPAAFALTLAYAVSDEVHQAFVRGREGHPRDVAIDALGAAIGLLAYRLRR